MKNYDYYLFDADGTLFDTVNLICNCFQYVAMKYADKTLMRDKIIKGIGLPLKEQIVNHLGLDVDYDKVVDDYRDYQFEIMEDKISLFPEVRETLKSIKEAGKKIAIVTSRKSESLKVFLDITDTSEFFDALVTPEDTDKHKPNPEPALKAMELIGADKNRTVFIGDAMFDICSGNSAGVDTVFVNWSHTKAEDLPEPPTYTIDTMSELIK